MTSADNKGIDHLFIFFHCVCMDYPAGFADMEYGGSELSDSGSSGYWSWEHGSVSPGPSPSITTADSSVEQMVDKGLHMELELGAYDELDTRRCKVIVMMGDWVNYVTAYVTDSLKNYHN